jgi:hypothetical protein
MALRQRRANLLATFDIQWSDFAWDLQRAKTVSAVRSAFQPVRTCSGIEPFICEPNPAATWIGLRALRRTLTDHEDQVAYAQAEEQSAKNRLGKVEGALVDVGPNNALKRACDKRRADYAVASRVLQDRQESIDRLRRELRGTEARISQLELLDFIASKRYKLTPVSLANAMAGLPFVTWRHSAARCLALAPSAIPGLTYQMFLDLKRALADPPRTKRDAVEQVRAFLLAHKKPLPQSIRQLGLDFYFVRISIEAAYRRKSVKDALPYRVSSEYRKRSSSRSRLDVSAGAKIDRITPRERRATAE